MCGSFIIKQGKQKDAKTDERKGDTMKKVITISREFGSGGRTIGREVAKRLGYSFYDKEPIKKIAKESGLSAEYIEAHGESSTGKSYFGYAFAGRDMSGSSVGDYLWKAQRDIIEKLAEKGKDYEPVRETGISPEKRLLEKDRTRARNKILWRILLTNG